MASLRFTRCGRAALLAGVGMLACTAGQARTWTMADGQRVLEANFVSLEKGVVVLQTSDDTMHRVRLAELSPIDRNLAERLGASSSKPVVVEVEADGLTPAEALQNAFMRAVHKAVGARVKTKRVVDGDEIIEDSVLIFSDGFVSEYDKVASRQEAGLCYQRIKATVQRRDVSEKPTAEESARDASHLYAEAFTKVQRHQVAMALLQDAIDHFNADLLEVTLLGRDKAEVLPDDLGTVRVRCDLRVRIRMDAYRDVFDSMVTSLNALARTKGSITTKTHTIKAEDAAAAPIIAQLEKQFLKSTDTSSIDYGTLFSLASDKPPTGGPDVESAVKRDTDSTFFFVCAPAPGSSGTFSAKNCQWRWFEIDGHPLLPAQEITTVMRFTSENGDSICEDRLPFGVRTPGLSASGRGKKVRTVIVSPFFLYHVARGYYVADIPHAREITIRKKLRVPLDALSRVRGERAFVTSTLLDRDADFPDDVDGGGSSRLLAKNAKQLGQAQRFAIRGGVIEVQTKLAATEMVFLISARGYGDDARPLTSWLASTEFQELVKERVLAVVGRGGGSFSGEFGPFEFPARDLITVEMTMRRK